MSYARGFPPVANKNARILILGSIPGQKSMEQHQYYAHPANAFWKITGRLFGFDPEETYSRRQAALKKNRVALWDVVKTCRRPGSLDSAIDHKSIVFNNFSKFFKDHPQLRAVFFNGQKAEQLFRRNIFKDIKPEQPLDFYLLPSTSPANAGTRPEEKFKRWRIILVCLK